MRPKRIETLSFFGLVYLLQAWASQLLCLFLPLYIEQLGNFSTDTLNILSSVTFAISFVMTAIISPYWGKLADKYGRKPMLLRASLGMAIVISLMAFVTNVWQLIILRALQGLLAASYLMRLH